MSKLLLFIPLLFLIGCSIKTMTNEEIIIEIQKCEEAGMEHKELIDGLSYKTRAIVCTKNPKLLNQ